VAVGHDFYEQYGYISQIFQKSKSHFQILGTSRVTCCKIHTKDPQFWSDMWTSLLPGKLYVFWTMHCDIPI